MSLDKKEKMNVGNKKKIGAFCKLEHEPELL